MMEPTPLRPDEQVAGGFIAMSLGGQPKRLSVLTIDRNRDWTARFNATVAETIGKAGQLNDLDDMVRLLAGSIDVMLDLLVAYDDSGALGGREWIHKNATDREVYEALKKVTDAAFPFGVDLVNRVPGFVGMMMEAAIRVASSQSTSSAPRSTAGRRARSKRG